MACTLLFIVFVQDKQKAAILDITGIAAFLCLYEKALKSKVGARMVHDPVI